MGHEDAKDRRRRWGEMVSLAFFLAVLCNTLEAFSAAPDGWGWRAFRITLSFVFLFLALGWLVAVVRERKVRRQRVSE